MIVGIQLNFSLITKLQIMAKIVEKTTEKTTYKLETSGDTISLPNVLFEILVNEPIILSMDNKKIYNQLSLL